MLERERRRMADSDLSERATMKVYVKTPKENSKECFEVTPTMTIKEFKQMVATKFSVEATQISMIFAGKILKDDDTLETHNIRNGLTIHMVIKPKPSSVPESTATRPTTGDTRDLPGRFGGMSSLLGNLSGASSILGNLAESAEMPQNLEDMNSYLANQYLQNPDAFRQVIENPLVQSFMSDPATMRTMISGMPQMQQLLERNPEINHMLNNPDLMRQTMELARNPAMLQELMRTHDRALSNLESIPGGYNALTRMYRDIQEPMLNAAHEQFNRNPFANLVDNGADTNNPQQGTENRDPLPNPWSSPSAPSTNSPTSGGTNGRTNNTLFNNASGLQGALSSLSALANLGNLPDFASLQGSGLGNLGGTGLGNLGGTGLGNFGGAGLGNLGGLGLGNTGRTGTVGGTGNTGGTGTAANQPETPGLEALRLVMRTLGADESDVGGPAPGSQAADGQNRANNPLVTALTDLIANPDLIRSMMETPQITALMQNMNDPDRMVDMIVNPDSAETAQHIRETQNNPPASDISPPSPETVREMLQRMLDMHQLGSSLENLNMIPEVQRSPPLPSNDDINAALLRIEENTDSRRRIDDFNDLLRQVGTVAGGGSGAPVEPEVRYRTQLDQLNAMGFCNPVTNLQALMEAFGDINGAIEKLLNLPESR